MDSSDTSNSDTSSSGVESSGDENNSGDEDARYSPVTPDVQDVTPVAAEPDQHPLYSPVTPDVQDVTPMATSINEPNQYLDPEVCQPSPRSVDAHPMAAERDKRSGFDPEAGPSRLRSVNAPDKWSHLDPEAGPSRVRSVDAPDKRSHLDPEAGPSRVRSVDAPDKRPHLDPEVCQPGPSHVSPRSVDAPAERSGFDPEAGPSRVRSVVPGHARSTLKRKSYVDTNQQDARPSRGASQSTLPCRFDQPDIIMLSDTSFVLCITSKGFTLTNGCAAYCKDDWNNWPNNLLYVLMDFDVGFITCTDNYTYEQFKRVSRKYHSFHPIRSIRVDIIQNLDNEKCFECKVACHRHRAATATAIRFRCFVKIISHKWVSP